MTKERQVTDAVLMIRPAGFMGNPLTAESNKFQGPIRSAVAPDEHERAVREFDGLAEALRRAGVRVHVYDDTREPHKPDAVFPNNWVSFHPDGTAVLYPKLAENRRTERRPDIIEDLATKQGYRVSRTVDLTHHEDRGAFLEGTGSLVLDRTHRSAYACLSPRTHLEPLGEFGQRLDYELIAFDAVGPTGDPIYHTNVMMCIGEGFAVVCSESIRDASQREAVLRGLRRTEHEVVEINYAQLEEFAGNMLALESENGASILAMSERAVISLADEQRVTLERYSEIVTAPIPTIEDSSGGSVRCMLAEIHLPRD